MTKKMGSIIALGVVALLAVVVVILYLIPVNYAPKLSAPNSIIVQQSSDKNATVLKENEEDIYNKIMKEFNKSLTRNLLSAIFAGQSSGGTNLTDNGLLPSTTTLPSADVQLVLTYDAQTLTINGKSQPRKVTNVIFQLSDTTTYQAATIYFQQEDGTGYYEYKTFAMQSNLYDYIMDLNIA